MVVSVNKIEHEGVAGISSRFDKSAVGERILEQK
jgi:hypothetical protein